MVSLLHEPPEIIMEHKKVFWGREKDHCKFLWKTYLVYAVCRLKGVYPKSTYAISNYDYIVLNWKKNMTEKINGIRRWNGNKI